jgi:aspartyl-tRNA(Asn)/glutamyl-tRNA(Gln) amidotransferase subunit C
MDGEIMKVTAKDVESVAILSRLELKETDMEKYTKHLNAFLEYADVMTSLNTDGVKPTDHVLPLQNVFREDVVKPSLDRELALSNAPQREDGYFKVPKILED